MKKNAICIVCTSKEPITDRDSLKKMVASIAKGAWNDFKVTNASIGGKAAKMAAGAAVGSKVATEFGALTPFKWAAKGFGPLPIEFTRSGAIQVFEFTTMQRAMHVAKAAGIKFALVTVAFEGGVLVGSVVNQTLSSEIKDAIGGTIDEIVNQGGWKLLFKHPFGIGM